MDCQSSLDQATTSKQCFAGRSQENIYKSVQRKGADRIDTEERDDPGYDPSGRGADPGHRPFG